MPLVTRKELLKLQRFFIARRGKPFEPSIYRLGFAVGAELLLFYGYHDAKGVILTALAYNPDADWRFVRKHRKWLYERWKQCGKLVGDIVESVRAFRRAIDEDD